MVLIWCRETIHHCLCKCSWHCLALVVIIALFLLQLITGRATLSTSDNHDRWKKCKNSTFLFLGCGLFNHHPAHVLTSFSIWYSPLNSLIQGLKEIDWLSWTVIWYWVRGAGIKVSLIATLSLLSSYLTSTSCCVIKKNTPHHLPPTPRQINEIR